MRPCWWAFFLVVTILLSGCSLRKDNEEEYPDEFARGLDYAEDSKIEYVEMDGAQDELTFDNEGGDLIAKADTPQTFQDDTSSYSSAQSKMGQSLWSDPPTASDWEDAEPEINDMDSSTFDAPEVDSGPGEISGAPITGAPIGGGLIPPSRDSPSPSPRSTVPEQQTSTLEDSPTDLDFSVDFDEFPSSGFAGSKSGLKITDPARSLADAESDMEGMASAYRSNTERSTTDFLTRSSDSVRDSMEKTSTSFDSAVAKTTSDFQSAASNGFDSSRAAQAIGSAGAIGGGESIQSPVSALNGETASPAANPIPQNRNISIPSSSAPTANAEIATSPQPTQSPIRAGASATQVPTDLPDPKTLKQRGIDAYHARDFDASVTAFRDYLGAYSEEEDAIRAWLGYALMADRRYGEASKEFTTLLNSANPELRADAHYYLGTIYDKQGNFEAAKVRWEQVIETYPDTKAAEKARNSLAQSSP